jgi:hypothetical protein
MLPVHPEGKAKPSLVFRVASAMGVVNLPDNDKRAESLAVAGELVRVMWVKSPLLPAGVEDPEQLNAEQMPLLT